MATTCHETVVGVSKVMLPVNTFAPTKPLFCVSQVSRRS